MTLTNSRAIRKRSQIATSNLLTARGVFTLSAAYDELNKMLMLTERQQLKIEDAKLTADIADIQSRQDRGLISGSQAGTERVTAQRGARDRKEKIEIDADLQRAKNERDRAEAFAADKERRQPLIDAYNKPLEDQGKITALTKLEEGDVRSAAEERKKQAQEKIDKLNKGTFYDSAMLPQNLAIAQANDARKIADLKEEIKRANETIALAEHETAIQQNKHTDLQTEQNKLKAEQNEVERARLKAIKDAGQADKEAAITGESRARRFSPNAPVRRPLRMRARRRKRIARRRFETRKSISRILRPRAMPSVPKIPAAPHSNGRALRSRTRFAPCAITAPRTSPSTTPRTRRTARRQSSRLKWKPNARSSVAGNSAKWT